MTGQISQEEAVRRISDWAKVAPKTAQPILERILSGDKKTKSTAKEPKTSTKKTTSPKLSADEKNVNLIDLQDKYMVLRSNPEATVEEYTELMNEIKDAAIFAFPTNFEGFPNALVEAIALGIPVVTTDFATGVARELVNENVGIVVPVGDTDAFADGLSKLLSDKEKREHLDRRAQKKRARRTGIC